MRKTLTIALSAVLVALGGCNVNDENPEAPDGVMSEDNVVYVDQGGFTDLLEQVKVYPEGMEATLSFRIIRQPEYADSGSTTWVSMGEVFTLDGTTLKSADVRVPDEIPVPNNLPTDAMTKKYQRAVMPGVLEVMARVGEDILSVEEFEIVQTNKDALPPLVVTFSANSQLTAGPDAQSRTISMARVTTGNGYTLEGANYFTTNIIDYNPANVLMRPQPDGQGYITMAGGMPRAGATSGTGDYMVGFYVSPRSATETPQEYTAREDAAFAAAVASGEHRIYVDVTDAPVVVGIELHPNIGVTNALSIYRVNAQKASSSFIRARYNDGTYEEANIAGISGDIVSGDFQAVSGDYICYGLGGTSSTAWTGHLGWHTNFNTIGTSTVPAGTTPGVGDRIECTITHKTHFLEPGWTVRLVTTYLPAAPES